MGPGRVLENSTAQASIPDLEVREFRIYGGRDDLLRALPRGYFGVLSTGGEHLHSARSHKPARPAHVAPIYGLRRLCGWPSAPLAVAGEPVRGLEGSYIVARFGAAGRQVAMAGSAGIRTNRSGRPRDQIPRHREPAQRGPARGRGPPASRSQHAPHGYPTPGGAEAQLPGGIQDGPLRRPRSSLFNLTMATVSMSN